MPRYDFACACGRVTESREGVNVEAIPCSCGRIAARISVYRDQFISCETGPKGGLKVEPPSNEKSRRKPFAEYQEAVGEIAHAYSQTDDPRVKAPDYYGQAKREAKKRGAKIASH